MRISNIEAWALRIADVVRRNQRVEDSRVELKATWPDPAKAARRVAGHANAARGEPILWLIGIDEQGRLSTSSTVDSADWVQQLASQFDGLYPDIQDVVVPVGSSTIHALLFDTTRAPFVVRNPQFGTAGTSVSLEVPWREGTAIRSARREDLVRILTPIQYAPVVDFFWGEVDLVNMAESYSSEPTDRWNLEAWLYIVPATRDRLVIPFHRCLAILVHPTDGQQLEAFRLHCEAPKKTTQTSYSTTGFGPPDEKVEPASLTIQATDTELVVDGPGPTHLRCLWESPRQPVDATKPVSIRVLFAPVGLELPVILSLAGEPVTPPANRPGRWKLTHPG